MDAVTPRRAISERRKVPSFPERVRTAWLELTASERKVATYLLDVHPDAAFETVREVAAAAQTSGRTVVRLVQKLRYAGYPEMQAEFRANIQRRLSSPIARLQAASDDVPSASLVSRAVGDMEDSLRLVAELSISDLKAAARSMLGEPGRLLIFGAGKSLALATYTWFELGLLRSQCILLSGQDLEVIDKCMDLSASDAVVVFEFRRYVHLTKLVASVAVEAGAQLTVITDSAMSPAGLKGDQVFVVKTQSTSMFDSYVAVFGLVDVLAHFCQLAVPGAKLRSRLARYEAVTNEARAFLQDTD